MKLHITPSRYLEPHYSSKAWLGYKLYFDNFYSESLFSDICKLLDVSDSFPTVNGSWASNSFANDFIKIAKEKTKDPLVALNSGMFILDPRCISDYEFILAKFLPFTATLLMLRYHATKINHFHDFKIISFWPGRMTFDMIPRSNETTCDDVFLNSLGLLKGLANLKNVKNFDVSFIRSKDRADHVTFKLSYQYSLHSMTKSLFVSLLFAAGLCLPSIISSFEPSNWSVPLFGNLAAIFYFLSIILCMVLSKFILLLRENHFSQVESLRKTQELYRVNLSLEERLNDRVLLEKSKRDIDAEKKRNEELISSFDKAVHDVRSPLTLFKVLSTHDSIDPQSRNLISNATSRIDGILLDLQSNVSATPEISYFDPKPILFQISKSMETIFKEEIDITFCEKSRIVIWGNAVTFNRLLSNIFTNSFESKTDKGTKLKVSLSIEEDFLVVKVIDSGKGIPNEILKDLGRKKISYGKSYGTGIGLYSSFKSVEAWGGRIRVDSQISEGTVVRLFFKFQELP